MINSNQLIQSSRLLVSTQCIIIRLRYISITLVDIRRTRHLLLQCCALTIAFRRALIYEIILTNYIWYIIFHLICTDIFLSPKSEWSCALLRLRSYLEIIMIRQARVISVEVILIIRFLISMYIAIFAF